MLPKLNLDGTLKKRTSAALDRMTEEGQPGGYSPRIHSSQGPKTPTGPGGEARTAAAPSSSSASSAAPTASAAATAGGASSHSSASNSPPHSQTGAVVLPSPHSSPHEMSLVEDGLVGISDPEMTAILAAKARHTSADRSPTTDRLIASGSAGPSTSASPGKRRAAPLATLVDHQQARQAAGEGDSPTRGSPHKSIAGDDAADGRGGQSPTPSSSSSAAGRRRAGLALTSPRQASPKGTAGQASAERGVSEGDATSPAFVRAVTAEELYVSGKPFQDYMSAYAPRPAPAEGASVTAGSTGPNTPTTAAGGAAGSAAGGAHLSATFHQNPSQYVSAIASQGDFVAVGDRTGRVVVMRQREMAANARRTLLEAIQRGEEAEAAAAAGGTVAAPVSPSPPRQIATLSHVRDPYEFHVAQQAYVPVIDTLNSVEVSPNVTALAFLPQTSPTTYLLAANEKVPKLFKIMSVRESANPFRAVDKIGTKTIGPLTASSRASTVAMKPVARYAMSHEYNIHSICPMAYSDQFATADDAAVLLWCTEYPDTSIETFDLRSPYDDGPREAIRGVRTFPHEPFLLFVATSAGTVRVVDTRQTLRWADQSAQVFVNPTRDEDEPFSNVTNSICDCALSPSGRYIAGRDFMSVCLWDIRMAGSGGGGGSRSGSPRRHTPPAARGESGQDCGVVRRWELHSSLRPDLESIYQSNLLFERFDVQFLSGSQVCTGGFDNTLYTMSVEGGSADASADIRTFKLPKTEGITDFRRTTVSAHTPEEDRASTGQGLGSRMTLMSRPSMSMSGTCGMVVACGQAVLQLSYSGVLA